MGRSKKTEYYNSRRTGQKTAVGRIVDMAVLVLSVIVAGAFIIALLSQWISPRVWGLASVFGLMMPVILIMNMVCLLYWVVKWRKQAFISLGVFAIGLFLMPKFLKMNFLMDYTQPDTRGSVSVVTYNVRGLVESVDKKAGKPISTMRQVAGVIDSLAPDIVCIQEFQSTAQYPRERFEAQLDGFDHKFVKYSITAGEDQGWGLAVYSRYPIVKTGSIEWEDSNNAVIWSDIKIQSDTIRLFNAHLQTTSIKSNDQQYIVQMEFMNDKLRSRKMRNIAGRLRFNYVKRSIQADSLAAGIAASPHPVIVCGDFNDTPVSYAYTTVGKGLKDCFREAGSGYGYTFRGFFDMLRIDYVFHSGEFECESYSSPDFDYSDHNPVSVRLRRI